MTDDTGQLQFATIPLLDFKEGRAIVRKTCADLGVSEGAFFGLVRAELKQAGKMKKKGLNDLFDDVFDDIDGESGDVD